MRKLIAVAVLFLVVSATNYLPVPKSFSPDWDGYLDRNVLCAWIGNGERHVLMFDADAEKESPCPRMSPGSPAYANLTNCAARCEPAAIAAEIVEQAKTMAVEAQERFKLLIASPFQS